MRVQETPPPSTPLPASNRRRATILAVLEAHQQLLSPEEHERIKKRRCDSAPPRLLAAGRSRRRASVLPSGGAVAEASPQLDHQAQAGAEDWPRFLARASTRIAAEGVAEIPAALFEAFRVTDNLGLAYAAFARLFHMATAPMSQGGRRKTVGLVAPPWTSDEKRKWRFPYEPIRLLLGGNWKAKQLWKLLDARCGRPEYEEAPAGLDGRLAGKRAVVVGAGPCGLRAAIELKLLGAQVTVVERRECFSRINQLHLWDWCGEELKQLGARVLEPPPCDFGADPDLLHISINDLQKLLLKVALLFGVEVLLGVDYVSTDWATGTGSLCGWEVRLQPRGSAHTAEGRAGLADSEHETVQNRLEPSPRAPTCLQGVAVLIGAGGFGCPIGRDAGMAEKESEHLRKETAIGLVCNFVRQRGPNEAKLRSFAMARQFYSRLFQQAAGATGAVLENIVYTKNHTSHYFVMTPTRECLINSGVVMDSSRQPLLDKDNVDPVRLDAFVRRVADFSYIEGQQAVYSAAAGDARGAEPRYADGGPRLFDFSQMKRSAEGLTLVRPPDCGNTDEHDLLVALVGDALIEPFWPEGLGIIRGFMGVLDICFSISQWAAGQNQAAVLDMFDEAFVRLKSLSAATRSHMLQGDERRYGLAPNTRYRPTANSAGNLSGSRGTLTARARDPPMVARARRRQQQQ